jgi:hypothetical protein
MAEKKLKDSQIIKNKLEAEFPNLKFSVTRDSFANGHSVDVVILGGNVQAFVDPNSEDNNGSVNIYHYESDDSLTPEMKAVIKKILQIAESVESYGRHSSAYFHLSIGKWNKPYVFDASKPSKPSRPNSSQDELVYEFKGWKMFKKIVKGKVLFVVVKDKETPTNREQWTEIKSDVYLQTGFKWNFGNFSKWESLPDGVFAKFEEIFAKYYPTQDKPQQEPTPQQEEEKPQPIYGENRPNGTPINDEWLKELTKTYTYPKDVLFKRERLIILDELEARLENTKEDFDKDTENYLRNNVNFLFSSIDSGDGEVNLLEGLAPMNFSNKEQKRNSYRELLDRVLEIGGFNGRLDAIYGVEITVDGEANTDGDKEYEEKLSIEEKRPVRYENIFHGGLLKAYTWWGLMNAIEIARNFLNDEFECSFKYAQFTQKFVDAFSEILVTLKRKNGDEEKANMYFRGLGDKFIYLLKFGSYTGLYANSFTAGYTLLYKLKNEQEGYLEYVKEIDIFGNGFVDAKYYLPQLQEQFPNLFPKPNEQEGTDKELLEKQTDALSMLLDYGGDTLTQDQKDTLEKQISALKTLINLI